MSSLYETIMQDPSVPYLATGVITFAAATTIGYFIGGRKNPVRIEKLRLLQEKEKTEQLDSSNDVELQRIGLERLTIESDAKLKDRDQHHKHSQETTQRNHERKLELIDKLKPVLEPLAGQLRQYLDGPDSPYKVQELRATYRAELCNEYQTFMGGDGSSTDLFDHLDHDDIDDVNRFIDGLVNMKHPLPRPTDLERSLRKITDLIP